MKYIKTRDALQAFYYLIAVDGSVRDDERALFDHIGDNLDAKHFHDYRKEIIDSCDPDVYLEVQHPCWSCNSNSSSANASAARCLFRSATPLLVL